MGLTALPLKRVFIEATRGCDLTCGFCPVPRIKGKKHMTPDTAARIAEQLRAFPAALNIIVAGRGEPSLNPYLLGILSKLRTIPNATITLETAGPAIWKKTFDPRTTETLCHKMVINTYPPAKEETQKATARLKGLQAPKFARGGTFVGGVAPLDPQTPPKRKYCEFPFESLTCLWDGTISLCPLDWKGEAQTGNIYRDNLTILWRHSPRLYWSRRFLANRIRCPFPWCATCNHEDRQPDHIKHRRLEQEDVHAMRRAWNLGGQDGTKKKEAHNGTLHNMPK